MRTAASELLAHIAGEVTTLCKLWRLIPTNGTTLYLTDHDEDVTYDGHVYQADQSFSMSAISNQLGSGQTNFEIDVILGGQISRESAMRGVYSGARVEVDAVNYESIADGVMPLATGLVSSISIPFKDQAILSCAGLASNGAKYLTEAYSASCRALFCDTRCSLNIADFMSDITVTGVSGTLTFAASGMNGEANYYNFGAVRWLSGENAGSVQEVRTSSGASVSLLIRPRFAVVIGDTATIERGCDKTLLTCNTTYDNMLNFRGEPFMPGNDFVAAPAAAKPPPTNPPKTTYPPKPVIPGAKYD